MNFSRLAARLREKMEDFLGNLSLPRTAHRFVLEALYGILNRQSVRLSEIARSLNEDIPLRKTVNRLSRQAARPDLHEEVYNFIRSEGAGAVGDRTLLVLDPSDIIKPYARRMEHLARVRDGSKKVIGNGYWFCDVVAVESGGVDITPMGRTLWSQEAPDFRSENAEILGLIDRISTATEKRGVWVIDRGGDRIKILAPLVHRDLDFIIRLVGNRDLEYRGRKVLAETLARDCPLHYAESITYENPDGSETVRTLRFGYRKVRLPGHKRQLYMLVLDGWGEKPTLLLTTLPLRKNRSVLWWIVEAYLTRWRIEETLRFAKQTQNLEDIRVLTYERLKSLMAIALLAMFFTMRHLGTRAKLAVLCHHAVRASERLFGIPDFRYYAIADGICEILQKRSARPFPNHGRRYEPDVQLDLFAKPRAPT